MPKILVVDDQRNMRTTLAMMLRGAGYEVDEASEQQRRRRSARVVSSYFPLLFLSNKWCEVLHL